MKMNSLGRLLPANRQKKYSVERLEHLYVDLLQQVDIANEDLGRHGVNEELYFSKHAPRFSLRRSLEELRERPSKPDEEDQRTAQRKRELATAFRLVAATRSADKEGSNGGAVATRNSASASALTLAKSVEDSVVDLIRSIGEVVVNAEQPSSRASGLRSDSAFQLFCEKSMLSLLVDIVKAKPCNAPKNRSSSCLYGVVWSPTVKAQVLHSVSLLISGVRDPSALYYLLSQNCINTLITCMLPLTQWTDPALEKMIPAYVDLLKNLALQLGGSPQLFPFFTVQAGDDVLFPLLSATIEVAMSSFAQSDSFVHISCLNLVVDIMQITYEPVRAWVCKAEQEQRHLADHLCQLLLRRYYKIANLSTGPVVDAVRSKAIGGQLTGLSDQMDVLNDIFACNINGLNVRLCEALLQRLVSVLVRNILPLKGRRFLNVGVTDTDVIPDREAYAQASVFFLSKLFQGMEFTPFVRMLAVALFHPQSTELWSSESSLPSGEYKLTTALNVLVQGRALESVPNGYRRELGKALQGDYGDWRVVPSAMLLENVLQSPSLDYKTLIHLEILPGSTEDNECVATLFEAAIVSFLMRRHTRVSTVSVAAQECVASLAVDFISRSTMGATDGGRVMQAFDAVFTRSIVRKALVSSKAHFFRQTVESQHAIGVSDIFVDLVEAAVLQRYKRVSTSVNNVRSGPLMHMYLISNSGCAAHGASPECTIRKFRSVGLNDVEATRFYAQMSLHFRAICRILDRFGAQLKNPNVDPTRSNKTAAPALVMEDRAEDLSLIFGGLREKPSTGTDLDLHGRMTFRFSSSSTKQRVLPPNQPIGDPSSERMRTFSDDMIFRPISSHLVLVLDPTDIYVVKPWPRREVNRGTVLCCIPLLNVIAAAKDDNWLHVAVRHSDVGFVIKNGNFALCFDSPGTCLIVLQYIDRCRQLLRQELLEKILCLFAVPDHDSDDASTTVQSDAQSVPHVKTF